MNEFDKNVGVAGAAKIIDDYIVKVVRTGLYKGDSGLESSEILLESTLWLLLMDTINEIELMYDPHYTKIRTIQELQEYLDNIPRNSFQSIGHYYSEGTLSLKPVFVEMANNIHEMMPFYKGLLYDIIWMNGLFKPW